MYVFEPTEQRLGLLDPNVTALACRATADSLMMGSSETSEDVKSSRGDDTSVCRRGGGKPQQSAVLFRVLTRGAPLRLDAAAATVLDGRSQLDRTVHWRVVPRGGTPIRIAPGQCLCCDAPRVGIAGATLRRQANEHRRTRQRRQRQYRRTDPNDDQDCPHTANHARARHVCNGGAFVMFRRALLR